MTKKILGYVWAVIINLITLFVVFSILSVADTSFEKIVLCFLVLIYLQIISISSVWSFQQLDFTGALYEEFKRIRHLLKEGTDEYEEEQAKEFKSKKDNITVTFYINAFFNFIIYVIIILNLLGALQGMM